MPVDITSDDEIAKKVKKYLKDLPINKRPYSSRENTTNSPNKKPSSPQKNVDK